MSLSPILRLQGKTTQPSMAVPICVYACSAASVVPALCNAMDCSLPGSSYTWDSPGNNTEMGCHAILQGIFPTQGSNLHLLHWRQIFLPLIHWGCPVPVYFMLIFQLGLSCNLFPLLILKYYTLYLFKSICHHFTSNLICSVSWVQLLSHVWLFATPWTAALQSSLVITNSQSLLKLMSIQSVMPSNHLILCHPLLLLPSIFPSIKVSFPMSQIFASGGQSIGASASVLPMNIRDWVPLG